MYFLRTAVLGMVRALPVTLPALLTLAAALWTMAVFVMALSGARLCLQMWGRGGHVSVGLALAVPRTDWPDALRAVQMQPGVREARLVPPEEALAAFRARGPMAAQMVQDVEAADLPASITVSPTASLVDAEALAALATRLSTLPNVTDVDYGAVPLARLRSVVRWCTAAVLALGGALALTMSFMVLNTVRLMLAARQEEVRILRLVGATAWFVRLPFVLEGALSGLAAGLVAAAALKLTQIVAAPSLLQLAAHLGGPPVVLFAWPVALGQLVAGTALGLTASHVAVGPFLAQDVG